MDRVWTIPETWWPEIGRMYRDEEWRSLTWVYNHFHVGGRGHKICECEGSFAKMKLVFEKFKDIYEEGDTGLGED